MHKLKKKKEYKMTSVFLQFHKSVNDFAQLNKNKVDKMLIYNNETNKS